MTSAGALGVDVGSTNVKVVRIDPDGEPAAWTSRPLATHRDGDEAEQDPEVLWHAVQDAVAEVTAGAVPVVAVGVCSQYSSIVPVDAGGRPVGPLVMWWDQRGTDRCWAIMERHPEAFATFVERHGIPPVGSGLSLGHLLHLQHDRPGIHDATTAWLEPMDYVVARLTERLVATQHSMFMAQVCDNRTAGAVAYDDDLVRLTGIDADRLPPLVAGGAIVGEVTAGPAAGATVRAGMNDSAAGALATGAFAPGRGGLAIGTTAVLLDAVADQRVDLEAELVSMPCPAGGPYLAWAENGIAGRAVEHALELLGAGFADLEPALASAEPGAGGVLFLPWLNGSLAPSADRHVRGGFAGVALSTTRADVLRALLEGTAHNLRWLLPAVERFTGTTIDELAFVGGAARTAGWAQVLADVLGRPVGPTRNAPWAVAQAAARHALDLDPAVPVTTWHEPRPEHADRYAEAQARFEAAHAAQHPR